MRTMIFTLLLAIQDPGPVLLDLDIRPPRSEEVLAAEARDRKRMPVIVALCRQAVRSGDLDRHVKLFADRNGLSSYERLALTMNCRLYEQGIRDRVR